MHTRSRITVLPGQRTLSLLLLALVVLFAPGAHAHTVAPLCDPSAASMPAPIPAPPSHTGDLVAPKTCDDSDLALFDATRPGQNSPPPELRSAPPDRVLPTGNHWGAPVATFVAAPCKVTAPHRPGYPPSVFRPPCA